MINLYVIVDWSILCMKSEQYAVAIYIVDWRYLENKLTN